MKVHIHGKMVGIYMVDKVNSTINPGYPLNSITKYKYIDKYLTETTEKDLEKIEVNEDDVVDFIARHIQLKVVLIFCFFNKKCVKKVFDKLSKQKGSEKYERKQYEYKLVKNDLYKLSLKPLFYKAFN